MTAGARRAAGPDATRFRLLWAGARDSLWFVPTLATLAAAALAAVVVRLDTRLEVRDLVTSHWIFQGGAEGARGVLSAIAGSLITVTGVIFSVTIVALQLASSQFTPRVLRGFVADRANQAVLGIFIGTFTYTLLVLRVVTASDEAGGGFVPAIGVTLSVVLVLVCIGALIFFIDHAARSIQASVILERESAETMRHLRELFPAGAGRPVEDAPPACPAEPAAYVLAGDAGYIQSVHATALFELAVARGLTLRLEPMVGAFVIAGEPLASAWPADAVDDDVRDAVRGAFTIGAERTPEQDVEFGIVVISDMAVKALSPGINDPTTAMQCIDRLGEILAALGASPAPTLARVDDAGALRLLARHPSYARAVGLAFDQIRHYGASNPAIAKRMLDTIARVRSLVPASRRPALDAEADTVLCAARASGVVVDEGRFGL